MKQKHFTTIGIMLAVMVAAVTLVFTVGPMVSAYRETNDNLLLVLDDWDDFNCSQGSGNITCYGINDSIICDLLGYDWDGCGGFWGESDKIYAYDYIRIIIPEGVTHMSGWCDFGAGFPGEFMERVIEVVLPSTLEYVGYHCLYPFPNIKEIALPEGVEKIDQYPFDYNVESLIIPNSVQFIPSDVDQYGGLPGKLYCAAASQPAGWECDLSEYDVVWDCYKTITFDTDGGNAIAGQTVCVDHFATRPVTPTKDGYTFKGWYLGSEAYDFNAPVTGNITLTAQWEADENQQNTQNENEQNENQEPETPTETSLVNETNKNGVIAAVAGTAGGVAGLGTIGTILGVAIAKKRKK